MLKNKINFILLSITIIAVLLLISGCSSLLFGSTGSIKVITNPPGAKIFLDGNDTGKITPYTLKNVSKGNHIIEVTLSDMKCTELAKVEEYQNTDINIEFYPQSILSRIKVLPSNLTITLGAENAVNISSVSAYYNDYSSVNLTLTDCNYSSNSASAKVSNSGTITGISEGEAIITVSYSKWGITKTDTVLIEVSNTPIKDNIIYRALLIGVGDYKNFPPFYPVANTTTDLLSPSYDVDRMRQTLEQCKFGSSDSAFYIINELKDWGAEKNAIFEEIYSTFSGADDNDISYFYFSGHGYLDTGTDISYLCPTDTSLAVDLSTMISVGELESALSTIPGTKVVIIDSCHSGGFIGKSEGENDSANNKLIDFNNNVVNVFSVNQSKGTLTTNQYKVLTSCHYFQTCLGAEDFIYPENSFGLFSIVFCEGCGYNVFSSPYPADDNEDNKVSLQEGYSYIESALELFEQDVQVYPIDSTFTIVEY
ncbi:MAG TPA: PEGA domain-containing protein [Candidatus Atribacteria bacterium]|nr:PEGA domain-containing protein [Candidatus Atribacteria bacterium]